MAAKAKLKILLIEDNVADAHLIERELTAAGLNFRLEQVQAEPELRRHIEAELPDLVLSDHGLPAFSGFKALEIVREKHPKLPFIFISGSNDQGMVADMYEAGATDYVFKRDISDLKSAVMEALHPPEDESPVSIDTAPAHFELGVYFPPGSAMPSSTARGRLLFCPECRQAWDENGARISMEDYCGTHNEIVVVRKRCIQCASTRQTAE